MDTKCEKALFVKRRSWTKLRMLSKQGVDITNQEKINKHFNIANDWHYGFKKGLSKSYKRLYVLDNFSYLIPTQICRYNKRAYLFLLRNVQSRYLVWLENILLSIHIMYLTVQQKTDVYYTHEMGRSTDQALKWFGANTIYLFHTPVTEAKNIWKSVAKSPPSLMVSVFDARRLLPSLSDINFMRLDMGADPTVYRPKSFRSEDRPIDLCLIGSFNDKVFQRRSRITDKLIREKIDSYNILIRGSFYFFSESKYTALTDKIGSPLFGKRYVDALNNSKLALVIPSDDHIEAGEGMPNRLFQNAAAGTTQLVYSCDAAKKYSDKLDFVLFKDLNDLFHKIEYLLNNEKKRKQLSKNSRDALVKHFSSESAPSRIKERLEDM